MSITINKSINQLLTEHLEQSIKIKTLLPNVTYITVSLRVLLRNRTNRMYVYVYVCIYVYVYTYI